MCGHPPQRDMLEHWGLVPEHPGTMQKPSAPSWQSRLREQCSRGAPVLSSPPAGLASNVQGKEKGFLAWGWGT